MHAQGVRLERVQFWKLLPFLHALDSLPMRLCIRPPASSCGVWYQAETVPVNPTLRSLGLQSAQQ